MLRALWFPGNVLAVIAVEKVRIYLTIQIVSDLTVEEVLWTAGLPSVTPLSQGSKTFNRKVSHNISPINFLLEGQSENNLCVVVVDETLGQPEGSLFMERIASSVPPSTGLIISDLIVFADCFIGQLFVTIRGERIIRYSNIIRITNIRIRIRPKIETQILFVFV